MGEYWKRAVNYAKKVKEGKIPACTYTRKAAERFLTDIDSKKYKVKREKVAEVCLFIENLNLNDLGTSKKFKLEDWQVFIIANIYGFYRKDGKRRFNYAYIEIPRKNGKSELVTALATYHFLFDDEAFITVSANSREQAKNTDFRKIKAFCHQLDPAEKELIPYFNSVVFGNNTVIVTSADSKRLDGLTVQPQ